MKWISQIEPSKPWAVILYLKITTSTWYDEWMNLFNWQVPHISTRKVSFIEHYWLKMQMNFLHHIERCVLFLDLLTSWRNNFEHMILGRSKYNCTRTAPHTAENHTRVFGLQQLEPKLGPRIYSCCINGLLQHQNLPGHTVSIFWKCQPSSYTYSVQLFD